MICHHNGDSYDDNLMIRIELVTGLFRSPLLCLSTLPPTFLDFDVSSADFVDALETLLTIGGCYRPFSDFTPSHPFHTLPPFLSNTLHICLFSVSHPSLISGGLFTNVSVFFFTAISKVFPRSPQIKLISTS